MSFTLTQKVVRNVTLPALEKMILTILADIVDDQGDNVFPSVSLIAARSGMAERTVHNKLNALEESGYIKRISRIGTSNYYVLNQSMIDEAAPIKSKYVCTTDRRSDSKPSKNVCTDDRGGSARGADKYINLKNNENISPELYFGDAWRDRDKPKEKPKLEIVKAKATKRRAPKLDHYELARFVHDQVTECYERKGIRKRKKPNIGNWANQCRLMIERDGLTPDEIRETMLYVQQHSFWHRVILSPTNLREHYDQIALQMADDVKSRRYRPTQAASGQNLPVRNMTPDECVEFEKLTGERGVFKGPELDRLLSQFCTEKGFIPREARRNSV